MAFSDMIISFAILAAALAGNDMGVAVTEFRRFCNQVGVNAPKNARQFIEMWAGRHNKQGEIDRHSRRSGRHEKLTTKMVDNAYRGITGWAEAGRKQPYKSERDIERKCPEVRQVLQDSGATMNTLMQRLKERYPKLQYKEIKTKWVLTEENKLVRYWVCVKTWWPVSRTCCRGWCLSMRRLCSCARAQSAAGSTPLCPTTVRASNQLCTRAR